HGMSAAFSLAAFSGIIDDEGIDERHISQEQIRETLAGEPYGFSRQPFERAVFANVHNRIGSPTSFFDWRSQPLIKSYVVMCGRQVWGVIDGIWVQSITARWLQRDQGVAQGHGCEPIAANVCPRLSIQ